MLSGAASFMSFAVNFILKFATRGIFLYYISIEYVGAISIFSDIVGTLSLVELGLGSALNYAFYKPLATKDYAQVRAIHELCKKLYLIFAGAVFTIGLIIVPFLPSILHEKVDLEYIYILYFLTLFTAVSSYIFRGKRPILSADQRQYIASLNDFFFNTGISVVQLAVLIFAPFDMSTKFLLYIMVLTLGKLLSVVRMKMVSDKLYKHIDQAPVIPLEKGAIRKMIKQASGILIETVTGKINIGIDNVLLAIYTSLSVVGLYANYTLLMTSLTTLINSTLSGVVPAFGQSAQIKTKEKMLELFHKYYFITFAMVAVISNVLLFGINPLMTVWIGEKYVLNGAIPVLLVLNFTITILLSGIRTFRNAYGMQWELRWVYILGSVVNFCVVMLCFNVFHLGIVSVLVSTTASLLIVEMWIPSYSLFKKKFQVPFSGYIVRTLCYFGSILLSAAVSYFATSLIPNNALYGFGTLFGRSFIALLIPCVVIIAFYSRTPEFKYSVDIIKKVFKKLRHK
jgi:O-antigen/teichoic acid export membrane protein